MPRLQTENNFKTELAENITDTQTSFDLDNTPNIEPPYRLTIRVGHPRDGEIIEVTEVDGNTVTAERGKEDTTAQSWDSGTLVENLYTAGMHNELVSEDEQTAENTSFDDTNVNYTAGELQTALESLTAEDSSFDDTNVSFTAGEVQTAVESLNEAENMKFDDTNFFESQSTVQSAIQALSSAGVVDEGSTADGDYIRYENGWQICIKVIEENEIVTTGSAGQLSVDYPNHFSEIPFSIHNFRGASGSLFLSNIASFWDFTDTTFEWRLRLFEIDDDGNVTRLENYDFDRGLVLFAIGRWK